MPYARRMNRRVSFLLVLASLLLGCAEPLQPADVTDRFWRAVITRHPAKIKRYVLPAAHDQLEDAKSLLPVSTFELGQILIDGDEARVVTTLSLDGDTPVPVTINTHLQRINNQWLVDYDATVSAITEQSELARMMQQIGKIGETLQQGIEQSVDQMKQTLPAITDELSRLESKIEQSLPELQEKLEAFSRQIEESIKQIPEQLPSEPEPEPDQTIAL